MSSHINRQFLQGASLIALSLAMAMQAVAQDGATAAAEGEVALDTIVVTGEKVARDLQNTASSVSVKSGRQLAKEKTASASVSEAIADVPNIVYTDSVGAPIIRGQDAQGPNTGATAFFAGTVPRATINLDGHYLSYNEAIYGATSVWDVDAIEVFRGPQTTTQGANAIAGAIIVNTKDPTFTPEGAYQAEIGSYNTRRASVALSGPIIEDELAGRIALDYSGRDTFIDYINAAFASTGTDQDFRAFNGRAKLLWQPSEMPELRVLATYTHHSSNRPSQEAASAPFDGLQHVTTTMPSWKQNTDTGILDISYDFENGMKFFNETQYTATNAVRTVGIANRGDADVDQRNVSNETRVTFGDPADEWSGVAGVYYAHTTSDELLLFSGVSTFKDTKNNLGVFGEVSYRPTDVWTLTGSLRYQRDQIQRVGNSGYTLTQVDYDNTFSALLPKLSVAYEAMPGLTVGGLVSRGYNPGGVSLDLTSRQWRNFEDESIWNFELFTRAKVLDDRMTLSANVFYMDFTNAQFNIPVTIGGVTQSYTINAEKAHAYGLELGADYEVLDNLTLRASAGVLRNRIDEMSGKAETVGHEFARSPGYSITFGASWDVTDKLNVSGQLRHLDGYYSDIDNTSTYAVDPYTLVDVQASYAFHDSLEFYGYVKNLFDDRSPTYKQLNRGIGNQLEASMTNPRMFGVGIKGSF